MLQHRAKIVDGQIHVGPLNYKILILPNIKAMPLETLRFVQQYVQQGGVVIALERVPDSSTGLADYAQKDRQVQALVREMFDEPVGDDGTAPKPYGQGRTYHIKRVIDRQDILDRRSSSLDPFVNALRDHVPPDFGIDFALQGLRENRGLTFLHRKMNQDDLYFVSNIQDQVSTIPVTFRVTDRVPWKWNPYTGEVTPLLTYTVKQGGIEIPLLLQPYESLFIVFTPGRQLHASQSSLHEILALEPRRMIGSAHSNGPFAVTLTDGVVSKTVQGNVTGLPAPLLISGEWRLVFPPSGSIDLDTTFTRLFSWTRVSRTRPFSGSGLYELSFTAPSVYVKEDLQLFLDLGRVGDIAEVMVNGQKVGVIWMRGQMLEVTGLIRAGTNRLSVKVTNTLINRVSGMKEAPPVPEELVEQYGRSLVQASAGPRSPMSFTALPASGLLGPVRLVVYKKIDCPL
ncbi:MAG: Glycosyl hydrolases family 2, sugar binding domain [bacterium ADurb.Bin478]|nr:MAG: Glycosyl hydrolases family 2, sugar binding domain [bacterium ADurb.Bin478]